MMHKRGLILNTSYKKDWIWWRSRKLLDRVFPIKSLKKWGLQFFYLALDPSEGTFWGSPPRGQN